MYSYYKGCTVPTNTAPEPENATLAVYGVFTLLLLKVRL